MRSRRAIVVAIAAIGLVAAGCGADDGDTGRAADAAASTERSTGSVDAAATDPDRDDSASTSAATTSTKAPSPASTGSTASTGGAASGAPRPEPANCESLEPGGGSFETDAGGPTTRVRVFVPPSFDGRPLPAVVNFHGLGSDGLQQSFLSGYAQLAADEGFVAVHPTGPQNSWELAQFDAPGRDDLAMVDDLIDRLVTEFCVDPTRIYSTGLSNGGFFTALLVCERADRIAAAISVAGVSHPDGCEPSRPVPFVAYHGTADDVVPFGGGTSTLQEDGSTAVGDDFFAQSMPDEFAEFAADFGCAAEPEVSDVGDEVIRYDYVDCDEGVPLTFYEVVGGGHTWPNSPLGPLLAGALGPTTTDVDATVDGWEFVSRFSLPDG
ncbi:MAG: prolyl oligopeptidase family serine peptidase [Actinomycetota bacterium]